MQNVSHTEAHTYYVLRGIFRWIVERYFGDFLKFRVKIKQIIMKIFETKINLW